MLQARGDGRAQNFRNYILSAPTCLVEQGKRFSLVTPAARRAPNIASVLKSRHENHQSAAAEALQSAHRVRANPPRAGAGSQERDHVAVLAAETCQEETRQKVAHSHVGCAG